jgi:hypothetical protein
MKLGRNSVVDKCNRLLAAQQRMRMKSRAFFKTNQCWRPIWEQTLSVRLFAHTPPPSSSTHQVGPQVFWHISALATEQILVKVNIEDFYENLRRTKFFKIVRKFK